MKIVDPDKLADVLRDLHGKLSAHELAIGLILLTQPDNIRKSIMAGLESLEDNEKLSPERRTAIASIRKSVGAVVSNIKDGGNE